MCNQHRSLYVSNMDPSVGLLLLLSDVRVSYGRSDLKWVFIRYTRRWTSYMRLGPCSGNFEE